MLQAYIITSGKFIPHMESIYKNELITNKYYVSDYIVRFALKQERKGKAIQLKDKHLNHLIFLLDGEMNVSCNEFHNHLFASGEMIFVAHDSTLATETYTDVRYLTLGFNNQVALFDQLGFDDLKEYANERSVFNKLDIHPALSAVISSIMFYQENEIEYQLLNDAKQKEIFLVLKTFYSKQDIARFLKPIINQDLDFKSFIIKHYMDAKNVEELAKICNLSVRSLTRKFKQHFNESPYKWMLVQRSHHVKALLANKKIPMQQIIKQYGFSSPAHFTTYCKKQFGVTPSSLRRELNMK